VRALDQLPGRLGSTPGIATSSSTSSETSSPPRPTVAVTVELDASMSRLPATSISALWKHAA
jgi:hypothetical protein